jgi:hypothetical protein
MLLGDLHSEALRVQIMDLLQAEWLHRAVADMVCARCIFICHYFYQLMVVACAQGVVVLLLRRIF